MKRVINTMLGTSLIVTALYLGATRVAFAEDMGAYSCCGTSTCRILDALSACPNGAADCGPGGTCCQDRCNDPKAD